MTRLLVFRGETLGQELDLARLPLTIGRGPANDLVLDDPVKSVSREHAEIRLEGGRYVLTDRGSENGIWVAGRRLPSVAFEPDTVASIGPFRLKIEGLTAGSADVSTPVLPDRTSWASGAFARRLTPQHKRVVGGVLALVAVGTLAVAGVVVRSARERERAASEIAASIVAANLQLDRGSCAEALAQNIQPALMRDPNNGDLLSLKQRAEGCLTVVPPPPDPPPVSPVEAALASVRALMAQGQCDEVLVQQIVAILTSEPDNADAMALKAEAQKCVITPVRPSTPAPRAPVLAQRIQPKDGGLEPLPGELDRDYQNRVGIMRQRYEEAVTAASKGTDRSIVDALEAIARDATPQYLNVSAILAAARRSFAETAQRMLSEAQELARKGRWNESLQKYNEAQAVDPSVSIEADVRKIQDSRKQAGLAACRSARQKMTYAPKEVPDLYRQVLELLTPDDECYQAAQKALTPK